MATTHIAFGKAGYIGGAVPIPALLFDSLSAATTQTMTPSGSSVQSTAAAPAGSSERPACRISSDTQVYVAVGASPHADAEPRILIPAGGVEYLMCNAGDKVAIMTG